MAEAINKAGQKVDYKAILESLRTLAHRTHDNQYKDSSFMSLVIGMQDSRVEGV